MKKNQELEKLRELSNDDLSAEAKRLKESLFRLRFKLSLGELDAAKSVRREKKSLARIGTIMRQRELPSK